MNEELKAKLLQYLDVLEEGARKGADLAAEKIPETIQQWVMFSIVSHTAMAIAFAVAATVLFVLVAKWCRKLDFSDTDTSLLAFPITFGSFAAVGMCIAAAVNAYWALMAWLAPNVFIIKELAALMK